MNTAFVDTSGFYAVLDGSDPYNPSAVAAFLRASSDDWSLHTTSYVVHESWALIQHRLGWQAVDAFLDRLVARCTVECVDATLHALGAARCKQARQRHVSLTDCVSFEHMRKIGIRHVIGNDPHFVREGFRLL